MKELKIRKSSVIWAVSILVYYCWFQMFYNAVRFDNMFPYEDMSDLAIGVTKNLIPIVLLFLLNYVIVFRMTNSISIGKKVCMDICMSILATVAVGYMYLFVRKLITGGSQIDISLVDWPGALLNDIIIFMGVELVYYFTMLLRSRGETEAMRRQVLQYQYDALKAQINPHFLFNSLNLLYSLVSIDGEKAKLFIGELAQMYRYVLAQQNQSTVSVEEELEFLRAYVSVLEMRYNNKFQVRISGEAPKGKSLVPFTMQLLIENVTKHNVISSSKPMEVILQVEKDQIIITNPIRPRQVDASSHVGLRYLTQLYTLHGRTFRTDCDSHSFRAYVPLI